MSFIVNVYENDTLKYWSKKLKNKWYRIPFLLTKNKEIETFQNAMDSYKIHEKNEIIDFKVSTLENYINHNSNIVVIIPAFISNKLSLYQLNRLVRRLNKQAIKPNKIIVVDDCSPIKYTLPNFVEHIKLKENKGPANARNVGIDRGFELHGDIFVFTDVDVVPSHNWIETIKEEFINNKYAHALSGKAFSYNKTWLGKYHDINGTLNGRKFINSDLLLYGPTCNLSITKNAILNTRFSVDFPKAAGEDIEFCYKLLDSNFNIFHSSKIIIYHDFGYKWYRPSKNLKLFKNQFVKYAKGERILLNKIPDYYYYLSNTVEISNV